MQFQPFHKLFFKAQTGAFSRVTDREFYDSQITLTGLEKEIVVKHFGKENILRGKKTGNEILASKTFFHYNTNQPIQLNLNFPKSQGFELRLYISKTSGFMPKGGMIWFIFESEYNELVIGAMDEITWGNLGQYDLEDENYANDIYQIIKPDVKKVAKLTKLSESPITKGVVKERETYLRSAQLALNRIYIAEFKCEIDSSHNTFTSIRTGLPFMEAHHFIPMKFQYLFSRSLDNIDNIICLCPTCHRAFHHAIVKEKLEFISRVYQDRSSIQKRHSLEEIAGYYNCFEL